MFRALGKIFNQGILWILRALCTLFSCWAFRGPYGVINYQALGGLRGTKWGNSIILPCKLIYCFFGKGIPKMWRVYARGILARYTPDLYGYIRDDSIYRGYTREVCRKLGLSWMIDCMTRDSRNSRNSGNKLHRKNTTFRVEIENLKTVIIHRLKVWNLWNTYI